MNVLYKLGKEGFDAYLVGGSVRDLIMGNSPKDFDVATDATPEQLRALFKNSRIIGRRFKIVHIRYGREIIEVTTFRAHHENVEVIRQSTATRKFLKHLDSAHSESGMLLRDNVFGDINDDALRRDFTINALYYTVNGFRVLDFCNGFDDIKNKIIRIVGDPEIRYKEDPVRMLRAIRFAAKLDCSMEKKTLAHIDPLSSLLGSIPPARRFDETLKLLSNGYGVKTFNLLRQFNIMEFLLPLTKARMTDESAEARLVELALKNTDSRLAEGKSITPIFLFAALLWPALKISLSDPHSKITPNLELLRKHANKLISEQSDYTAIPKRIAVGIREIWELQVRLEKRNPRNVWSVFAHPRFRAAYDFLLLRVQAGEKLEELSKWWTDFQFSDTNSQQEMLDQVNSNRTKSRQRRPTSKRRRK